MPCYANPNPLFQPAMRIITNITNTNPAIVTTSFDHNYLTGENLRLYVSAEFGMSQINEMTGYIEVLSPTTFSISIDSTSFDPFVIPPSPKTCSQVCPVGEINSMLTAATHNVLG
jgi:hypothetical protein